MTPQTHPPQIQILPSPTSVTFPRALSHLLSPSSLHLCSLTFSLPALPTPLGSYPLMSCHLTTQRELPSNHSLPSKHLLSFSSASGKQVSLWLSKPGPALLSPDHHPLGQEHAPSLLPFLPIIDRATSAGGSVPSPIGLTKSLPCWNKPPLDPVELLP